MRYIYSGKHVGYGLRGQPNLLLSQTTCLFIYCLFLFVCLFFSLRDQTQSLMHGRQVLYQLSYTHSSYFRTYVS